KFSEAISSRPSCWRFSSLVMAWAISGSTAESGRAIDSFDMGTPVETVLLGYDGRGNGGKSRGRADWHPAYRRNRLALRRVFSGLLSSHSRTTSTRQPRA